MIISVFAIVPMVANRDIITIVLINGDHDASLFIDARLFSCRTDGSGIINRSDFVQLRRSRGALCSSAWPANGDLAVFWFCRLNVFAYGNEARGKREYRNSPYFSMLKEASQ